KGSAQDFALHKSLHEALTAEVDLRTTELQQANHELIVVNNELTRSNELLEEFAHASSHDLKEPVRKIQLFTNMLQSKLADRLDEDQSKAFAKIQIAAGRMNNLIDDMLKYSQLTYRQEAKQPVNLSRIMETVLEDLELHIEETQALVSVEDLPSVHGSERQLQQLFQNLVANALKYRNLLTAPLINISGRILTKELLSYAVIEVADNGIGFEPKYKEKIFRIFQRLHDQQEYSGTGVGLSIARKVAENHNGYITVESVPGEGSKFFVFLPLN
ncbi:MAG: hypothetical protein EOO02_08665, partial [Chitinophagaceae bacterium]